MTKWNNLTTAIGLLSYSMSLLYALQTIPGRRLGEDNRPLEDLTTLDIHIVNSSPLFHSEPWEILMHRLPKLKNLNITFVMQGKPFRQSFNLNLLAKLNLNRCETCKSKNRIIRYSVKQMFYHMFFSLEEYTRPDVVVVYGNMYETSGDDGDIHSEISYSNMTHSRETVVVLMDATTSLLTQGIKAVNAARPVDQIVKVQTNELAGSSIESCVLILQWWKI